MEELVFLDFDPSEHRPQREEVLDLMGVPPKGSLSADSEKLLHGVLDEVVESARPKALYRPISREAFAQVFEGEGLNDWPNPIGEVFQKSDRQALFALTLGPAIVARIRAAFDDQDFAFGYLLDSAASVLAGNLAAKVEKHYEEAVAGPENLQVLARAAMRYSPGYCGWHLTAQRKLFACLDPGQIGITINESCLMTPIKSVSGVFLLGMPQIHYFDNDYSFCDHCRTKNCRPRMRDLKVRQGILVWPPTSIQAH